jgi:hypothetical protein
MRLLPGTLAVSRLPGTDPFPAWAEGPGVVALTRRGDALAILSMPVLITTTMGRPEFYRSAFFLSGVATVGLIGVLGLVAAIALFRGGTTPSSER